MTEETKPEPVNTQALNYTGRMVVVAELCDGRALEILVSAELPALKEILETIVKEPTATLAVHSYTDEPEEAS